MTQSTTFEYIKLFLVVAKSRQKYLSRRRSHCFYQQQTESILQLACLFNHESLFFCFAHCLPLIDERWKHFGRMTGKSVVVTIPSDIRPRLRQTALILRVCPNITLQKWWAIALITHKTKQLNGPRRFPRVLTPQTPRDFFAHRLDTYTNNLPSITQQSKFGPTHLEKKRSRDREKRAIFAYFLGGAHENPGVELTTERINNNEAKSLAATARGKAAGEFRCHKQALGARAGERGS